MKAAWSVRDTMKKMLALVLALTVSAAFMPAVAQTVYAKTDRHSSGPRDHKISIEEFRSDGDGAEDDLDGYKALIREYVEESFGEYVAEDGPSAYCAAVWKEITNAYSGALSYIDAAKDESELFETDGFFIYPAERIENEIYVIEALGELTLHYVKDEKSGISLLKRSVKESIDSCRLQFAEYTYNDFYAARIKDLLLDAESGLKKVKNFRDCVMLEARIDEDLISNLPTAEDLMIIFDEEEEPAGRSFKYLYTADEVDLQREAAANRITCYVDVQLKISGYKGDTRALKKEAESVIKSLGKIEIVEEIWAKADSWIAGAEKRTGIHYADLGEGDRLRAMKELRQLSYQYTQTDYSEDAWMEIEDIFDEAAVIIAGAEKSAEIKYVVSDAKKKLAKVLTLAAETAKVKKQAVKAMAKYKNKKKYTAKGVKLAKATIKKIKKSNDLTKIYELWQDGERKCAKHIRKFRIRVRKKGPGTVTKSAYVKYGGKYTVKLKPKAGRRIKSVTIDGKRKKLKNKYTFKNVKKKHTVKVVFGW